jgi:hypothetical protein
MAPVGVPERTGVVFCGGIGRGICIYIIVDSRACIGGTAIIGDWPEFSGC